MVRGILIIIISVFSSSAFSMTEKLGRLEMTDILIKPDFLLKEPQEGEFNLGPTSVQFTWFVEKHFQSKVRIGPKTMRKPMARFNNAVSNELGLVEAYGQYSSLYGEVKAGLIPLNYAAEGSMGQGQLYFPRNKLITKRVMTMRDVGFEYSVQHNGYFSDLKVHNGEGETNPDGRMWLTGNWGWKDRNKFKVGLSGLTGSTKPVSTSTSGDTLANVDPAEEAHWRMGTFFLKWYPGIWKTMIEFTMGEVAQGPDDDVKGKFAMGHVDLIYEKKNWGLMARWEYMDPNSEANNDLERETSIGFMLKNDNQTSRLFVIGTKVIDDGQQVANDQLRLVWQLTPLVTNY